MRRTEAVVIGGGQAGLAMSRCLSDLGVEHVVLERGRVAERWRSERWDSLRLLTPNWQSRLPGFRYQGPDPDGYMRMPEVVDYLERYARSFAAPVEAGTTVLSVEPAGTGYRVATDRGSWEAPSVVVATGHCDTPLVPGLARQFSDRVTQVVPTRYRDPGQLPQGGVLVVGASASGVQLAHEIHASGRPVTLAVGRHTRLPRVYRGRDILWWLDAMGIFDESVADVFDLAISRGQPSLQLVGRPDHATLDLPELQERGVRLVGRATAFISFSDSRCMESASMTKTGLPTFVATRSFDLKSSWSVLSSAIPSKMMASLPWAFLYSCVKTFSIFFSMFARAVSGTFGLISLKYCASSGPPVVIWSRMRFWNSSSFSFNVFRHVTTRIFSGSIFKSTGAPPAPVGLEIRDDQIHVDE